MYLLMTTALLHVQTQFLMTISSLHGLSLSLEHLLEELLHRVLPSIECKLSLADATSNRLLATFLEKILDLRVSTSSTNTNTGHQHRYLQSISGSTTVANIRHVIKLAVCEIVMCRLCFQTCSEYGNENN